MAAQNPSALEILGQLLKKDRDKRGLTQQALAQLVGCELSSVIDIEAGRVELSKGMALKLQDALQIKDNSLYNLIAALQRDRAKRKSERRRGLDERTRKILRDLSAG